MRGSRYIRALRAAPLGFVRRSRFLIAALAVGAFSPAPVCAEDAPIIVTIWGLRYSDGLVWVDVCTQETFLRSTCPYIASAPAMIGETTVTVPHVPPGVYAIQAFHDFNGNERVDQGFLGIPKEGIAFSQDAPLGLHGPSFAQAAFTHGDSPQPLRLRLHRFRKAPKPDPSAAPP